MNAMNTLLLLVAAYLAVFVESRFAFFRNLVGAQVDLLPALMVYGGLTSSLPAAALVAIISGLWFDSLSANPFGVSVIPLALTALIAHAGRDTLLREEASIQYLLGLAACAGVPLLTLGLLLALGQDPLRGGWFVWRWIAGAALSASFTPLCFRTFAILQGALNYRPEPSQSFRPDREIDRGRDPHAHL